MSANKDDIFDEDFDDFDNAGAAKPSTSDDKVAGGTLLDMWDNNPMVKLAIIGGLLIVAVGSVYAFVGNSEKNKPPAASRLGGAVAEKEVVGSEVSETYGDALDEQNQQKLEQALGNRNVSAIPVPVNRGDTSLVPDGTQETFASEDPLAIWQRENRPEEKAPEVIPEPTIPPAPPPPVAIPQEQMQDMSQAIAQQIQSILENRTIKSAQYVSYSVAIDPGEFGMRSDNPRPETSPINSTVNADGTVTEGRDVEEILIPAGTILYGQILNEANSDSPGPIIAQILSGPFANSRLIGTFDSKNEKIIISFDTAVMNGVGTKVDAVAIDPATTSPGLATDVDRRYFRRIVLPAAASFVEGLGSAYAESETEVITTGDVIVTNEDKLKTKQQFAKGIEKAAERTGDILEEEADKLEPLVRVEAGTPVGIILVEPIMKPRSAGQYNPEGLTNG